MNILEIKGINKIFGGLIAVDDLSFDIKEREIVSLIGPNGAGKTTTFNLITGFLKPNSGKIIYKGANITNDESYFISKMGMIRTFQKTKIFPSATVMESVKMGCYRIAEYSKLDILFHTKKFEREEEKVNKRIHEVLEYFNLKGIKDFISNNLAYGQKRILEIAIAVASYPQLLLLDEPAAGLNIEESSELMKLIFNLRDQGITILLVEHDMNLVRNISDRIIVMNFGKKIYEGIPKDVYSNKEVIEAYLGGNY